MSNPDFSRMTKVQIAAWAADLGTVIPTDILKDDMIVQAEALTRQGIPVAAPADDRESPNAAPAAPAPSAAPNASGLLRVKVTAFRLSSGPTVTHNGDTRHFPIGEWVERVPRSFVPALEEGGVEFETEEYDA
jgi:hypothetical protein